MVRKIKAKKPNVSKDIGKTLQKTREGSPYIKNLRKKYPLSKPCIYWDDNRDTELEEKGRIFLKNGDLDRAKSTFEELLAISTYHHSPCEFLAYTLYLKEEEQEFREWLMDEVVKTATFFYEEDTLDRDVLDQILENQQRMKEGKELIKWWSREENDLIADDGKNIDCDLNREEEHEESNKVIVKRKPKKCPVCGFSPVATILYGYPAFSPELQEEMKAGKTTLGGCEISSWQPRWECTKCGTLFYIDSDKELL